MIKADPIGAEGEVCISVALVTRNRPESLERTLRSLRAQNVQPFEMVVSDDSDDDQSHETERVAEDYRCRYIRGPRRGLYANRNHVALVCRGTHIRTMDDDHELPEHHIALCLDAVMSNSEAIWVIGEHYPESHFYPIPPPSPGQFQPRGFSTPPTDAAHNWAIADGSTIFPRSIFTRGILYSEAFKFGSTFYEFGSRLFWLGYQFRFLSTTYVLHHSQEFERTGQTVWAGSAQVTLASRYYAMLCHSFIYQPTLRNKTQTRLQIARELLTKPKATFRALHHAKNAYRTTRRIALEQWLAYAIPELN